MTKEQQDGDEAAPTADELKDKWLDEIIEAQSQADELDVKRAAAEQSAKAAKKAHESAVDRLQQLIRRGPSAQLELNFSGMTPEEARQAKWDAMLAGAVVRESLDLTPKQFERLEEAGVKTMKDLEDLRAGKNKDYPRGLVDISGFGERAIDKIEDEIEAWLETNQPDESEDDDSLEDAIAGKFEEAGLLAK